MKINYSIIGKRIGIVLSFFAISLAGIYGNECDNPGEILISYENPTLEQLMEGVRRSRLEKMERRLWRDIQIQEKRAIEPRPVDQKHLKKEMGRISSIIKPWFEKRKRPDHRYRKGDMTFDPELFRQMARWITYNFELKDYYSVVALCAIVTESDFDSDSYGEPLIKLLVELKDYETAHWLLRKLLKREKEVEEHSYLEDFRNWYCSQGLPNDDVDL